MALELKNLEAEFVSIFDVEIADFEQKTFKDENDKILTKTAPNGKALYRTTLQAIVETKDGKQRADKNMTLSLIEPMEIKAGVRYVVDTSKDVWATPYVNNANRSALSVIATALVEKPIKVRAPKLTGE